jgi:hypothetical protein
VGSEMCIRDSNNTIKNALLKLNKEDFCRIISCF